MWIIRRGFMHSDQHTGRTTRHNFLILKSCRTSIRFSGRLKYLVVYGTRSFGWRNVWLKFRCYNDSQDGSDVSLYFHKDNDYNEYRLYARWSDIYKTDLDRLIGMIVTGNICDIHSQIKVGDVCLLELLDKLRGE